MLAARMYGVNDLRVEEMPKPSAGPGEVVLQVKAAAICGTDVRMLTNGAAGVDEAHPLVLGHEFAGIVHEVGEGAEGVALGDKVAVAPNVGCGHCDLCVAGNGHLCAEYKAPGINSDGGFAEYVLLSAAMVRAGNLAMLSGASYIEGALNEPLSCAFNGFERCNIRPGDYVLVVGAGPIGLMHAKLARLAGAARVVLSDLAEERLAEAKKIDPGFTTVGGLDDDKVKSLTRGHGFDVIVTAAPAPAAQQASFRQAAVNGRICFFGGLPKAKEEVPLNSNLIHYKQLIVTGTTRASLSQYRKTLALISDGILSVRDLATRKAPLKDIPELFEAAKKAEGLKNVIEF